MKNTSRLREARAIVQQMPYSEAVRLRRLLTIPCNRQRRASLIARECGSIGALIVADTFSRTLGELRRCA